MARGICERCAFAFGTKKICLNEDSEDYGEPHREYKVIREKGSSKLMKVMVKDKRLRECFSKKRKNKDGGKK